MKRFNFQNKNWKFVKVKIEDTYEDVPNPGRGWYQIYSFRVEKIPDFDRLESCVVESERLALLIMNIGEYKNGNLDQQILKNIEQIISFFVKKKKDIILRFVYDDKGKGLEHEPPTLAKIEEHMKALEPVFRRFHNHLYIIQGLFIGSWGEMHTSKFLSEECLKKLYRTLLSVTEERSFLSVRRPIHWRLLENSDDTFRLGLFNDGMLATESHLGTFGVKPRGKADWKEAWIPEDELNFINHLCRRVPMGGEAVLGEMSDKLSPAETVEILKQMHVSYLNNMHDKRLLSKWKNQTLEGCNLYEYIGAHLGYRFVIKDVEVSFPWGKTNVRLHVQIENKGFSNCYEEGKTYVQIKTKNGEVLTRETNWDIREWDAGETVRLVMDIPLVEGKLYIKTVRKKDGVTIRYAQREEKDRVYIGRIENVNRG